MAWRAAIPFFWMAIMFGLRLLPTQVVNVVSLVGAVKSPGPYEYRAGMQVKDLLIPSNLPSMPMRIELKSCGPIR